MDWEDRKKLLPFMCTLFVLWMASPSAAAPDASGIMKKSPEPDNLPIEITADRFEAHEKKQLVLFTGNAVAVQGDRVIRADRITLYYRKAGSDAGKEPAGLFGNTAELERIEAKGRVQVSQGDRTVMGEQAVFHQDTRKIVVTGNTMIRQGKSVVRGERIEVYIDENRGVVEGAVNQRVKATIFPGEKKAVP